MEDTYKLAIKIGYTMKVAKIFVSLSLLVSMAACMSDENKNSLATTTNHLKSSHTELQKKHSPSTSRSVNEATSVNNKSGFIMPTESANTTQPLKRPRFKDFIDGGKLLKKVKNNFIKANSWLVLYETKDEFPQLQVILLSPDNTGNYQKVAIDSFDYDGAAPQAKEIFFADIDEDGAKELVILCTWEVKHQGLGINATDYKVSIYDNEIDSDTHKVKQMSELMDKFGSGTEGAMETTTEHYQWKDKATILQAIKEFSVP